LSVATALFTKSVWRRPVSAWPLDLTEATISAMDVLAILLALLMFAVLFALVWGIDAI
jgi:hypothetical protein